MRASFGSSIGFLLSAAGSAIGLGNIWKFPYIVGMNGGGLFVLFYIACVLLVALPVLISEIAIGQEAQSNAVKSFDILEKKPSNFKVAGVLGVISCLLISAVYGVVGGWIIFYLFESVANFAEFSSAESNGRLFGLMFENPQIALICQAIFQIIVIGIVAKGVNSGIERINKIAIPFLALILLFLLYTVLDLPGFGKAMNFLFWPHANAFTFKGAMEAIGHSFFTVSVGVGIMITYGSYLAPKTNIARLSVVIVIADTLIALMCAVVIFTVIFSFNSSPSEGPSLIFKTLPVLFAQMNNGMFVAISFFVLVLLTALTSAISIVEVPVAYIIDKGFSRKNAIIMVTALIIAVGIPCGLSFNLLADVKIFGKVIFDLLDAFTSNIMLPASGLLCVLFFGFKMNNKSILKLNFPNPKVAKTFVLMARFFAPASIVAIFIGRVFG